MKSLLLVALLVVSLTGCADTDTKSTIRDLEAQKIEVIGDLSDVALRLRKMKDMGATPAEIARAASQIEELDTELTKIKDMLAEAKRQAREQRERGWEALTRIAAIAMGAIGLGGLAGKA